MLAATYYIKLKLNQRDVYKRQVDLGKVGSVIEDKADDCGQKTIGGRQSKDKVRSKIYDHQLEN